LVVKGTPVQRAEAQGRLLGKELSLASFDHFADILLAGLKDSPISYWFADKALGIWTWLYDRTAPDEYHEEVKALAAGAGLSVNRARRALLFPDTALFFWAYLDHPISQVPGIACTSAAKVYPDGRMVTGRNLDFYGVGTYDAHPLMIVNLPADGSDELKHIGFATDGTPFAGITGLNEAGIGFSVHQNYTRDASLGGVPMPYIGELILRKARTLDEAVEMVRTYRPGPLWTFILTDFKTNEVRAIEVSKKHFEIRSMTEGLFSQSNHSFHDSVRADEFIDVGTKVNSVFRTERALQLLRELKGEPGEVMARLLSDQKEENGDLSVHLDIVKPLTIQSVILEKHKDQSLFVNLSFEAAPSSSGRFAGFKIDDLWQSLGAGELNATLANLSGTPASKRQRQIETARAFAAYSDPLRLKEAIGILRPQNSSGALLALSILSRMDGDFSGALELIQLARQQNSFSSEPRYIRESFAWVELATLLSADRNDEAKAAAAAILQAVPVDPRLKHFAEDVTGGKSPNGAESQPGYDFFSGYFEYVPLQPEAWKNLDASALLRP
jgi:hypothetical protein